MIDSAFNPAATRLVVVTNNNFYDADHFDKFSDCIRDSLGGACDYRVDFSGNAALITLGDESGCATMTCFARDKSAEPFDLTQAISNIRTQPMVAEVRLIDMSGHIPAECGAVQAFCAAVSLKVEEHIKDEVREDSVLSKILYHPYSPISFIATPIGIMEFFSDQRQSRGIDGAVSTAQNAFKKALIQGMSAQEPIRGLLHAELRQLDNRVQSDVSLFTSAEDVIPASVVTPEVLIALDKAKAIRLYNMASYVAGSRDLRWHPGF